MVQDFSRFLKLVVIISAVVAACGCTSSTSGSKAVMTLQASGQNSITTREITLDSNRHLVISTQLAQATDPWLVYIPGSGDNLNPLDQFEPIQILLAHHSYNVLVINKIGVGLDGNVADEEAFQRGSIRSQRIHDNLTVMHALVPAGASIQLMALSEGSYIAPEIAATDTRVKSLILLSGNTWSWLEEEVMWLPADQQQARRDFLENVVVPNPVFDKYYGDFWSYAYFDSYNTDMTYRTLEASQLPVLALNGVNDDVLWIQGAVDNMHKLINVEHKRNIEFHMIPSATHYLRCDPDDTTCDQAAMSAIVKGYLDSFVDRTL